MKQVKPAKEYNLENPTEKNVLEYDCGKYMLVIRYHNEYIKGWRYVIVDKFYKKQISPVQYTCEHDAIATAKWLDSALDSVLTSTERDIDPAVSFDTASLLIGFSSLIKLGVKRSEVKTVLENYDKAPLELKRVDKEAPAWKLERVK